MRWSVNHQSDVYNSEFTTSSNIKVHCLRSHNFTTPNLDMPYIFVFYICRIMYAYLNTKKKRTMINDLFLFYFSVLKRLPLRLLRRKLQKPAKLLLKKWLLRKPKRNQLPLLKKKMVTQMAIKLKPKMATQTVIQMVTPLMVTQMAIQKMVTHQTAKTSIGKKTCLLEKAASR